MSSSLSSTSRIAASRIIHLSKREIKRRAFIRLGIRPDTPAMLADDALNGCQPHSGAGKLFGVMQPLERAEQLAGIDHVESGAIIPNVVSLRSIDRLDT